MFGLYVYLEDEYNYVYGDGVIMEFYVGYGLVVMVGKIIIICVDLENFSEGGC